MSGWAVWRCVTNNERAIIRNFAAERAQVGGWLSRPKRRDSDLLIAIPFMLGFFPSASISAVVCGTGVALGDPRDRVSNH